MTESLHGYFVRLFLICLAAALAEMICEHTKSAGGSVGNAVRLICSLCVCVTVFSAFLSGTGITEKAEDLWNYAEQSTFSQEETSGTAMLMEQTRQNLENELAAKIFEHYGIKTTAVRIEFSMNRTENGTEVSVAALEIRFPAGTPTADTLAVKSYAESVLGCNCVVKTEE